MKKLLIVFLLLPLFGKAQNSDVSLNAGPSIPLNSPYTKIGYNIGLAADIAMKSHFGVSACIGYYRNDYVTQDYFSYYSAGYSEVYYVIGGLFVAIPIKALTISFHLRAGLLSGTGYDQWNTSYYTLKSNYFVLNPGVDIRYAISSHLCIKVSIDVYSYDFSKQHFRSLSDGALPIIINPLISIGYYF